MATHSSVLAWRIPEMGEPGGLPSMRSHRVGHNWSDLAAATLTGMLTYLNASCTMLFSLKNSSWPYTMNMSSCSSPHHPSQSASHFPPFHHFPPLPQSESEICSVESNSLQPHGLYSLWNSPGQNTGVGSLSLLQGIFPTQGSNPRLTHCRRILYQLSHQGSPLVV